jgi:A/G-specific adenine glycosylase
MLRGRELTSFRRKLLGWFQRYQRDLPWRRTKDPYCIWLSEIMLQQTRVAAVIPYYERFLARFPDVRALATAPEDEVLRLWSGLGYYSRARNLQRAAREIVAKHDGVFPRAHEDVLALSGIGDYTAAAILSIACGARHAVLDGNVARVLARLLAVKGDLREGGRWQSLQRSAEELLDGRFPGDWNQAMMELGATVCTPRSPRCLVCPVAQFCHARKQGIAESLPMARRKPATVGVTLAAAVLVDARGQSLLLAPKVDAVKDARHDDVGALVSRMWHFPMVSVRKDATVELTDFLKMLATKRPRSRALALEPLAQVRHTVTHRRITVLPFRVRVAKLPGVAGGKVCAVREVASASSLAISNLTRKIAGAALAHDGLDAHLANPRPSEASLFAPDELMQPASQRYH